MENFSVITVDLYLRQVQKHKHVNYIIERCYQAPITDKKFDHLSKSFVNGAIINSDGDESVSCWHKGRRKNNSSCLLEKRDTIGFTRIGLLA